MKSFKYKKNFFKPKFFDSQIKTGITEKSKHEPNLNLKFVSIKLKQINSDFKTVGKRNSFKFLN